MENLWYRKVAACCHEQTVSVISDGVEREICEDCGNVTVRYESMISGSVSRSAFSRRADEEHVSRSDDRRWPVMLESLLARYKW
ncbi:MAG TPA: hypothetical protein VMP13_05280 [Acidimicrobiia bacterium]|nr:hypothetical protein [Acidimicrobiia bacterium]